MTTTTAPGKIVIRGDNDSPSPITGVVLGHEDEDRVWVAWGDARYAADQWREARIEWIDDLAAYRPQPSGRWFMDCSPNS